MQHREIAAQRVASVDSAAAHAPNTQLRGWWHVVGRVLWMILFVVNLVWFGMTLVSWVEAVEHPCRGTLCVIAPAQVEILRHLGISLRVVAVYFTGIPLLLVLAGSMVAVLLFWRRSDDWLALVVGLFLMVYPITSFSLTLGSQALSLFVLLLEVPNIIIYYGVFLIFPDGRFVPRWTWLLLVGWAAFIWAGNVATLLGAQGPGWAALGYPLLYLSALGTQVYRFRRVSNARQRQQTKWVILGFAVALVANILFWIVLPAVIQAFQWQWPQTLYFLAAYPIYELTTVALPMSFAIAIQRHQLFDVDVLIQRTLVYGSLSLILAALYFSLVLGAQAVTERLTGQGEPAIILVASTLLTAALVNPLRHRLQAIIDRRFYRNKYDAARTLEAFGETLRTEMDVHALSQQLLAVVQETMQPASVSLWLREARKTPLDERAGGSD